jgi:hypothetical protein
VSFRTHVVRTGDTLWGLAATYLGDGNRWREVLALNTSVRGAQSLTVGDTIRIPASAVAQQNIPGGPARAMVDTFVPSWVTSQARPPGRRTIFYGVQPAGGFAPPDSSRRVAVDPSAPTGMYEAMSAPFVSDSLTLSTMGRCVSVGPTSAAEARGPALSETMVIRPPGGASAADSRWLLVRQGPFLAGLGPVAIPTGVVRLTSPTQSGASAVAEVVAQFGFISCNDLVLPSPSVPARPTGNLMPVSNGPRGRVAWVQNESLLPSLAHALIVDIGAAEGVRLGDRLTIYGADGRAVVASADVVRVDHRSATVRVAHQSQPSLAPGLPVRVTEKLP